MAELDADTLGMLKKAFAMFDQGKTGLIETAKLATIFNTLGQQVDGEELDRAIAEYDKEKMGKLDFDAFVAIAANFLEPEDDEAMAAELKEAFRLYDKEGNGYITTLVLRDILGALDDKLTQEDLDGMIEEIDEDGSGTVDFEEFMEMMTG